jgi:apolipoprotein N-acyltransferase
MLLLAGLLHAASTAWPFDFGFLRGQTLWWMQWFSLGLLAWTLLRARNTGQAFVAGWGFGTVCLAATFWWLFVAMHTYGGLAAPLATLAVFLLAALLALYYGAACALWWRLAQRHAAPSALLFGVIWMMAEMARGTWLTGFGWGAGGYAHLDGPLAYYAPWVGVYGITGLAAGLAMGAARLGAGLLSPRPRGRETGLGMALLIALPLLVPARWNEWTHSNGSLSVTLLQGNIPQNEKFEVSTGVARALAWYHTELLGARTALVVAPETALPVLPQQLPDGYWDSLRTALDAPIVLPPWDAEATRLDVGAEVAALGAPLGDALELMQSGARGEEGAEAGEEGELQAGDTVQFAPCSRRRMRRRTSRRATSSRCPRFSVRISPRSSFA